MSAARSRTAWVMPSVLTAFLACPECETEFEGAWAVAGDMSDMAEAPVATQTCPNGHQTEQEYPGWSFMSEAG